MNINKNIDVKQYLQNLSDKDFQNLWAGQIAYMRPIKRENSTAYAVHTADGSQLIIADTARDAQIVMIKNDLEPITVH